MDPWTTIPPAPSGAAIIPLVSMYACSWYGVWYVPSTTTTPSRASATPASPRRTFQWVMISPRVSDSSMSRSGGMGSYSTAMVASASCSAARDSAATRATASPTCRTSPSASTGQSGWIIGMRFLPGMSAAVSTAWTPVMPRAAPTSIRVIRAYAWGERSTPPMRAPAAGRSST